MRIAEFITANVEPILSEWETFARSIWPKGAVADPVELRDSADDILRAIVADMATAQTPHQESEKSAGHVNGSAESHRLNYASQVHGAERVGSGLALPAVIAEYRALRASVLRLWRDSQPNADTHDLDDITRFNEAIDQSLARSVEAFTQRIDASRKMFLAILGHDLRNPLSAITLSAKLAESSDPAALPGQLAQIIESAKSISELITDLIDFASTAMGAGIPLTPAHADLHLICDEVVREMRASHPDRNLRLHLHGDLAGIWDAHRLRQVLANLLANAIQHGSRTGPIDLTADGSAPHTVVVTVHNSGPPIPPDMLHTIFDPLTRGRGAVQHRDTQGSIGLGLYIVREIATAHGGSAQLTSDSTGTTATIRLPRHARTNAK
jgi:hypothetical protein